ncbi:hypothetical protein [Croceibacterium ferulae]|uniref:hypothetical protein n=1 Tax=Croceibacterium ferulae TaxID=1854641 RepID=UPI000EAD6174|nr:hypothetical protein [Croceibacterium ferulae]
MSKLNKDEQLILTIVITNAGGVGKTTWAEQLNGMARLSEKKVIAVDLDPGNRGFLNRNGDDSAVPLDWSPMKIDGSAPADPGRWYEEHLAGQNLVILDTGANMLAAANSINQFIGGLIGVARENGSRVIIYCVTSPLKPGSDELIELMYNRFRRGAEVVIVQNNRDGSGSFASSLSAMGTPVIALPHLDTGLQEVRLRRRLPLDVVLRQPEPGYERATELLAKRLLAVAKQEPVIDVVGRGAMECLQTLSAGAPASLRFRLDRFMHASNDAIRANERLMMTNRQFMAAVPENEAAFFAAARAHWEAEQKWKAYSR